MADQFWRVQVLGTTPSTQDVVKTFADGGAEEGLAIQALQQTGGRGRHGNHWASPMGNLYLSVLLRPRCAASVSAQLAFVVALALSDAIDGIMAEYHVKTLKWPNDILIDNKKVSGILLENKLDSHGSAEYIIVGTGVNIFAVPEGAIGLDEVKRERLAINTFRDSYLDCLLKRYRTWQQEGFASVRSAWLERAHGLGREMSIRLPEIKYQGVFEGLDEDGTLLAIVDGETKRFTAGEVHFGQANDGV